MVRRFRRMISGSTSLERTEGGLILLRPQPPDDLGAVGHDAQGDVDCLFERLRTGLLQAMPSLRILPRIASHRASGQAGSGHRPGHFEYAPFIPPAAGG